MNISVVIPNFNGEELIKKNLPKVVKAVEGYKVGAVEIIVVDDGSTDGSINALNNLIKGQLSSFKDKIKILKQEKNLGFSSTVNNGVKKATGEVVILLNSDVVPESNFLEPLLSHFKDLQLFAVGCMDKSIEDGKITLRGRGIGKWRRGFLVHARGEIDKTNTLWVSGGSSALRKSIWEKLGGLNELYNPFYWEDIDISYRALKSGYKLLFEPKSIVVHEHEKGAIKNKYSKDTVTEIVYRNQFIFVWENATDYSLQFTHFVFLSYHFVKALLRGDWAFFSGFFKALVLLPKILKSSFTYQRSFIKNDSEVTREF